MCVFSFFVFRTVEPVVASKDTRKKKDLFSYFHIFSVSSFMERALHVIFSKKHCFKRKVRCGLYLTSQLNIKERTNWYSAALEPALKYLHPDFQASSSSKFFKPLPRDRQEDKLSIFISIDFSFTVYDCPLY